MWGRVNGLFQRSKNKSIQLIALSYAIHFLRAQQRIEQCNYGQVHVNGTHFHIL